jgi:hypothetical protein
MSDNPITVTITIVLGPGSYVVERTVSLSGICLVGAGR